MCNSNLLLSFDKKKKKHMNYTYFHFVGAFKQPKYHQNWRRENRLLIHISENLIDSIVATWVKRDENTVAEYKNARCSASMLEQQSQTVCRQRWRWDRSLFVLFLCVYFSLQILNFQAKAYFRGSRIGELTGACNCHGIHLWWSSVLVKFLRLSIIRVEKRKEIKLFHSCRL